MGFDNKSEQRTITLEKYITTSLEEIAAYFSAPLVALRTLKSEVVAGLQPEQASA